MSDKNHKAYSSKDILKWYGDLTVILPVEEYVFRANESILNTGTPLDIGIGGGRTTRYLIEKCKQYTGIDYSEGFVNGVKAVYPKADIRLMDARNLCAFKDHSFDMVNFSFNGIDYVDLKDREKILSEIGRILKPGGIFFFSTHNMDHISLTKTLWTDHAISLFARIKTVVKLMPFYGRNLFNKVKEVKTKNYSIINDSAHNYRLMTFYTTPGFVEQQLHSHHFEDVVFYSKSEKIDNLKKLDNWIFITCKKLAV